MVAPDTWLRAFIRWPAALALACLLLGCQMGGSVPTGPSAAADEVIASSADEEERKGLTQARDDIDAEQREVVARKDAEIEKLRKENEALRARLKK
ncbi:MAG TPA: hypothetical protein VGK94_09295 [Candidatus Polarisedimenticolia bacterium]|jgi:hypothetical protein